MYLYPVSGVLIREKLENEIIVNFKDLLKTAFDILRCEYKVKDNKLFEPVLDWTDEEPLEKILERYKIMAGDLYSTRDNLERMLSFIGIIAGYLSSNGDDLRESLNKISEMCVTLKTRLHYGVKEDLFDLVVKIDNVGRARARLLYQAGYHTASQVYKEEPYILHTKTGLGLELCKKIIVNKNREIEEKGSDEE